MPVASSAASGHMIHDEEPETYFETVRAFIDRN